MANITPELNAFRSAIYGEEVRSAMISLAQKLNTVVSGGSTGAYYVLSSETGNSPRIVFNVDAHTVTFPATQFVIIGEHPYSIGAKTVDASSVIEYGAFIIWITSSRELYAGKWNNPRLSDGDCFLGAVYHDHIYINGVSADRIKVIKNNKPFGNPSPGNGNSFYGINFDPWARKSGTDVSRYITYNYSTKHVTFPGGCFIRKNDYASTTQLIDVDISSVITDDAAILVLDTNGNISGKVYNADLAAGDTIIGYVFGPNIQVFGANPNSLRVIHNINYDGHTHSNVQYQSSHPDSLLCISGYQYVTYDPVTKILTIPQAWAITDDMAISRRQLVIDLSDVDTTFDAYMLWQKCAIGSQTIDIVATGWEYNATGYVPGPEYRLIGYIYNENCYIKGIPSDRIIVSSSSSSTTVYCFGDSITAGVGCDTVYHMLWHKWHNTVHFKNYGVGSTGYSYAASGSLLTGNGVEGKGSNKTWSGNNTIKQIMQSVSETMDKIIIAGGTNDWASSQNQSTFRTAVQQTLDYALSKTSKVLVILPIKRDNWNTASTPLKTYSDIIKTECESRGITYFDGFDVGINPTISHLKTNFIPDGVHPNDNGQIKMARAIENKMLEALCIS